MTSERRRHERFDIMAHVRVRRGTINYVLDVTNVSLSGVFVSTLGLPRGIAFAVGQAVELNLFVAEEAENVPVLGRIVRLVEIESPPTRGFGVEFVDVGEATRAGIGRIVEFARSSEVPRPPPLPI
jgi:hypothetical protein